MPRLQNTFSYEDNCSEFSFSSSKKVWTRVYLESNFDDFDPTCLRITWDVGLLEMDSPINVLNKPL